MPFFGCLKTEQAIAKR